MARGNASFKLGTETPGPWMEWEETSLAERCIRFIETYCRPPKGFGHGEPMKLAPFQKQWLRTVLSPGVKVAALQLPRGNGKSTLLAALALWAVFDRSDSGDPQVPIIATTVDQARKSVFDVATRMVEEEPELRKRCHLHMAQTSSKIVVPSTGGICWPKANKVDSLQGLDPSLAVMDEIGFQPIEAWMSVVLASGKRPRSLVVGIGTPGVDRENALWQVRQSWKDGKSTPGFHFQEYSAPENCNHRDPEMWRLANPALAAGYKDYDGMEMALDLMPESQFRIFHLGQWVDGTTSWLGYDGRRTWDRLADRSFKPVKGLPIWAGLDVSRNRDSTALVIAQRKPDGKLHFNAKIWYPKDDKVTSAVDISDVMDTIRKLDRKFELQEVAYDPRFFELAADALADEGVSMVEFPQSLERMSPAFGGLYEAIMRGELTHSGAADFSTQVLNGVMKPNERGFTLTKAKSRGKIDAAVALAMCHARASIPTKPRRPLILL